LSDHIRAPWAERSRLAAETLKLCLLRGAIILRLVILAFGTVRFP
jgi:hypothetical protein